MENTLLEFPYQNHPHIALIRLNRPSVLNALSTALMKELSEVLLALDKNNDCRVIILTGNERAFAAGADIAEMAEETPADQVLKQSFFSWEMLSYIKTPLVAAVNGLALGGGCELAMACDFIIASETAKFSQPEIKIGTIPGAGGTQRLTRAIGKSKAMMMILTGEMIDAQKAYDWGLVSRVVPSEALLMETFEIAKMIARHSPLATRLAKEAVNRAHETSLSEGMEFERRNFYLTFSFLDQKEGMRAFVEKRSPQYTGK